MGGVTELATTSHDIDSLTVLVFARDDSADVGPLVARLDRVLGEADPEILLVHDRRHAKPELIWSTVLTASGTLGLIRPSGPRASGSRRSDSLERYPAREDWVVVMDGDRRHPAELVPRLLRAGQDTRADVVAASGDGASAPGGTAAVGGGERRPPSGADRLGARLRLPRRLTDGSDPMGGFFVVRRDCLDVEMHRSREPRISRRIRGRAPRLSVTELRSGHRPDVASEPTIPADERPGAAPVSAARPAASRDRWRSVVRAVAFAAVGVTGLAVNSAALWGFVDVLGLGLVLAATLATQVSTAWNFVLSDALVFKGPKQRSSWSRFVGFALVNNTVLLLRLPLLSWLVYTVGIAYLWANVLSLLAAFVARFLISDRYLFRTWSSDDPHAREAVAVRRIGGRHSSAGSPAAGPDGTVGSPRGARDRPDGSRLAVPA